MSKRKKKKPTEEKADWFTESKGKLLFLWRTEPNSGMIMLGGNRTGYLSLVSAIKKLQTGHPFVKSSFRKPENAPPIQWQPSPLNNRFEVPIAEIEDDFRRRVSSFTRFVWFDSIIWSINHDSYYSTCKFVGHELRCKLAKDHVSEVIDIILDASFPAFGGTQLVPAEKGHGLWISGDWLGVE